MGKGRRATRRRAYYREVARLTKEHGFESRWHRTVDHIVPVSYGFKKGIPPELIASKENLQVLSLEDNAHKSHRLTPEARVLLEKWGY